MEREEEPRAPVTPRAPALVPKSGPQARTLGFIARVVRLELALFPQGFESTAELVENVRHVRLRHLDHPLVPAEESRLR